MSTVDLQITDDQYAATQAQVELLSRLLLSIDPATLDAFVARANSMHTLGPILDPTLYRDAVGKLDEVIGCAEALRTARAAVDRIAQR